MAITQDLAEWKKNLPLQHVLCRFTFLYFSTARQSFPLHKKKFIVLKSFTVNFDLFFASAGIIWSNVQVLLSRCL